jgi:ABC-type Zn uptake system ZnuABC Zn-binding protein ZnuA
LSTACNSSEERIQETDNGVPLIFVTNAFLYEVTDRLAGDRVEIRWVCPNDPRHCFPGQELVGQMQSADMIILNGGAYEAWVQQISLPGDVIVNSAFHFRDRWIEDASEVRHSHGGHEHKHAAYNPYFWFDPDLAELQVEPIVEALIEQLPEDEELILKRQQEIVTKIQQIEDEWRMVLESAGQQFIHCDDPELDYLFDAFELAILSSEEISMLEVEADKILSFGIDSNRPNQCTIDLIEEKDSLSYFERMRRNIERVGQAVSGQQLLDNAIP